MTTSRRRHELRLGHRSRVQALAELGGEAEVVGKVGSAAVDCSTHTLNLGFVAQVESIDAHRALLTGTGTLGEASLSDRVESCNLARQTLDFSAERGEFITDRSVNIAHRRGGMLRGKTKFGYELLVVLELESKTREVFAEGRNQVLES